MKQWDCVFPGRPKLIHAQAALTVVYVISRGAVQEKKSAHAKTKEAAGSAHCPSWISVVRLAVFRVGIAQQGFLAVPYRTKAALPHRDASCRPHWKLFFTIAIPLHSFSLHRRPLRVNNSPPHALRTYSTPTPSTLIATHPIAIGHHSQPAARHVELPRGTVSDPAMQYRRLLQCSFCDCILRAVTILQRKTD